MSSEYTETSPELTIQEERLQFRSEKKRQKDTACPGLVSHAAQPPSTDAPEFILMVERLGFREAGMMLRGGREGRVGGVFWGGLDDLI
ncbi:MAG: hypothetical protein DIAAKJNI_00505 [Candidatus Argoarchaeum ethanivorans]|uniref:Uncharacterized protein n=1 Tax=Candidatus Argoarchaeum ethanivorans TaxID=2608793 RepID=A0A811T7V2_9EURY|nr:MAG: hypothetical protein DIAAKJNI_00505 [Candidatus Argoarchaeum ethanivorans]